MHEFVVAFFSQQVDSIAGIKYCTTGLNEIVSF